MAQAPGTTGLREAVGAPSCDPMEPPQGREHMDRVLVGLTVVSVWSPRERRQRTLGLEVGGRGISKGFQGEVL